MVTEELINFANQLKGNAQVDGNKRVKNKVKGKRK
jgi:hypothetical protein